MGDFRTNNFVLDSNAASIEASTNASVHTEGVTNTSSDTCMNEDSAIPTLISTRDIKTMNPNVFVRVETFASEMSCKADCEYIVSTCPDVNAKVFKHSLFCQTLSELYFDGNDTIKYGDNTLLPTIPNLTYAVDRRLLTYYYLQSDCLKSKYSPIPPAILHFVDIQFRKSRVNKKPLVFPLPELMHLKTSENNQRAVPTFAYHAQMLLLSQRLFLRRDASSALSSPEHLCCFISYATQKALLEYEKQMSGQTTLHFTEKEKVKYVAEQSGILQNEKFSLEDYILFERATACSFFVEVAGALSVISVDARIACLKVLLTPENFAFFLDSPFLFSRIALARQFVFEADHIIQRQFCKSTLKGHELINAQIVVAQKLLNVLRSTFANETFIPDCFEKTIVKKGDSKNTKCAPVVVDSERKSRCRDKAYANIRAITEPINLCVYAENPIYGPIAFCNPNHKDILSMLQDIATYNVFVSKPKQKKQRPPTSNSFGWTLFSELSSAAETLFFPSDSAPETSQSHSI